MKETIMQQLLTALGIKSQRKFANEVGIPTTTLSNYMRGRQIDTEYVAKIKKRYPQVNTDWLITGEGEIFVSAQPVKMGPMSPEQAEIVKQLEEEIRDLKAEIYDLKKGMQGGAFGDQNSHVQKASFDSP